MTPSLFPLQPVLLVDDEPQFLQSASFSLRSAGLGNIFKCQDSREVLSILSQTPVSVVVLDLLMPHCTGKELLPRVVEAHPDLPVIVITAVNDVDTAVECMRLGAFDYMVKPVDKTRLVTCVRKALEHRDLSQENVRLKEGLLSNALRSPQAFEDIVTRNPAMFSTFRYVEAISCSQHPVLITGETGVGKEGIARSIHAASGRSGAFIPVNVAGLDDSLFSDALFGHVKGAFTGAQGSREGFIAKASGGTVFLDEIGDLSAESQVKLLRVLEDRLYYPVGSDAPASTDARFVVATNRPIDKMHREARFRSDLYYRLQTHAIRIPPLRDRKEDIDLLLDHFLDKASEEFGKKRPTPPPELAALLYAYDFPGNVREFKSMVFDAVSRHQGGVLSMESFRDRIGQDLRASAQAPAGPGNPKLVFLERLPTLREAEDLLVAESLSRAKNNQSVAAQMLGITRSALNKRINNPKRQDPPPAIS